MRLMTAAAIAPTTVAFENDCFFVAVLIHWVHNQDSFKQLITRRFGVVSVSIPAPCARRVVSVTRLNTRTPESPLSR